MLKIILIPFCLWLATITTYSQEDSILIEFSLIVDTAFFDKPDQCEAKKENYFLNIYEKDSLIVNKEIVRSTNVELFQPKINRSYDLLLYTEKDSVIVIRDSFSTWNVTANKRIIRELNYKPIKRFHPLSFPELTYDCDTCIVLNKNNLNSLRGVLDYLEYECHVILKFEMLENELNEKRFEKIQQILIENKIDPNRITATFISSFVKNKMNISIQSYDHSPENSQK